MKIPNAELAIVEIRKLRDYCLNPTHDEGKHKARLFKMALGMTANDAEDLRNILLQAVKTHEDARLGRRDEYGQRYLLDFIIEWQDKRALVRSGWIIEHNNDIPRLTTCYPLWIERFPMASKIKLLDVVALTVDLPKYNLWQGQVGTVVEILAGGSAYEVEFCDRNGRTYESLGLRPDQIMVLHYEPAETAFETEAMPA